MSSPRIVRARHGAGLSGRQPRRMICEPDAQMELRCCNLHACYVLIFHARLRAALLVFGFWAAAFLALDFWPADFLVGDFLAGAFLEVVFLTVSFLGVAFLDEGFLGFLAVWNIGGS